MNKNDGVVLLLRNEGGKMKCPYCKKELNLQLDEGKLINIIKTVQFKDFIPDNGVRGTNKRTLHFKARKRIAHAIAQAKGEIVK